MSHVAVDSSEMMCEVEGNKSLPTQQQITLQQLILAALRECGIIDT